MDYILKANLVLLLFYLFYQLALKGHTFFNANRWFLILGLLVSVLIPFIIIPNYIYYEPVSSNSSTNFNFVLTEIAVSETPKPFNFLAWLPYAYIVGMSFFLIKLLLEVKSLFNLISKSKTELRQGYKLILSNQNLAPFSFFKWIVVNPEQFNTEELDLVLQHEIVHVKEYHSIDMMLSQLFTIVFWYNPIAWFYKKALQQNLEFIADQKVHDQSQHQHLYQKLLLKTSIPNQELAFTNTFYNSTIKKRIVMLHKSKSKSFFKLQFLLIIPILGMFLLSMNTKDIYVPLEIEDTINIKDIKIVFNKDMSDKTLKSIKEDLKDNNILMVIKKISRNNDAEIIEIDIDFETANGRANYSVKEPDGIEPFYFEMLADDGGFGVFTLNSDKKTKYRLIQSKIIKNASNLNDTLFIKTDSSKTYTTIRQLKGAVQPNDSINKINASLSSLRPSQIAINGNVVYYINNKLSSADAIKNILPDNIESMTVIKDKKELKKLKHGDKDGVVKIVLKNPLRISMTPTQIVSYKLSQQDENDSKNILGLFKTKDLDKSTLLFNKPVSDSLVFRVNGKEVKHSEIEGIQPSDIYSIEVINDQSTLKELGFKNNVKLVDLKTHALSNHILQNVNNNAVYYKVDRVEYKYDKESSKSGFTQYLYKETTDAELNLQIKNLKEYGVTMSYSKLKRNKNGDITNIKVRLQNDEGQEIEDTFSEKNGAVVMEYGLSNGKLKISKLTE